MWRTVVGVIVGYLAMAVFVFVTFSVAYIVMGTSGAFEPGSYDVSAAWIATSFVLGFVGAVIGGLVCMAIARTSKATVALVVVVLVLGLLSAVPVLMAPDEEPGPRPEDLSGLEAMQSARQPAWVALLNPLVGVAGVLVGARFVPAR